ncbi:MULTISPECIES: substrate-binding domain-containing protein [Caballeronia]|uniref:substrate-binding domain-containing protein n=1 Tax=Caballeronia TaxID=1827195 RepID=UPI00025BB080|nr:MULTISPECIES: substrate-binding domain-containing protein [Caballeronia]EKS70212.1 molybdate transport system substrate-binding protein [Burkholderia sp. SJ98]MDR5790907.1 substrate-binding domain-containing protein [Caballeronia sp. LP003]
MSITGISSMATRQVLNDLACAYEAQSGQRVAIVSVGGVAAVRRIEAGEAFDIVVLASDAIDRLAASGHVDAASRVRIARSGVAIAVKAGARRPAIDDEAAVREAVLAARTIGYSTGPSGVYLTRLFERWGLAQRIASRIVQAPPGVAVGALIARGEVELGFQQLSEMIGVEGIDVLGMLPPAIQTQTVFEGAIGANASASKDARAFLAFLGSSDTDATKIEHGMEPVN